MTLQNLVANDFQTTVAVLLVIVLGTVWVVASFAMHQLGRAKGYAEGKSLNAPLVDALKKQVQSYGELIDALNRQVDAQKSQIEAQERLVSAYESQRAAPKVTHGGK